MLRSVVVASLILSPALASAQEAAAPATTPPEVAPFPGPPNPPPIDPEHPRPRQVKRDEGYFDYAETIPSRWLFPEKLPYVEGRPAPDGYRVQTDRDARLVGSGLAMLITAWSVSISALSLVYEDKRNDSKTSESYLPLLIPVVGPIVAMRTAHDAHLRNSGPSEGTTAVFVLDGFVQTAGVLLLAAGLLNKQRSFVRVDQAARVLPDVKIGGRALSATWRF